MTSFLGLLGLRRVWMDSSNGPQTVRQSRLTSQGLFKTQKKNSLKKNCVALVISLTKSVP